MTPEQLFNQNMRLAYHFGRLWANRLPFIDKDDIYQETLLGLWKASKAFDPSRGWTFGTLAAVCINNQVLMMLRKNDRWKPLLSSNAPIHEDSEGNELTLEDLQTRPQAIVDLEAGIRRTAPTRAASFLDGYTQSEIAQAKGVTQATVSRRMARELRRLCATFDAPMTQVSQRTKMTAQPCWDLRTEGESGPVTVRRVTEEEAALYARQDPTRKGGAVSERTNRRADRALRAGERGSTGQARLAQGGYRDDDTRCCDPQD